MTTIETAPPSGLKRWWSRSTFFSDGGGERFRRIPFGRVQWDGSRQAVEIRQNIGNTAREDRFNPWLSPHPRAYINICAADARQCRAAAKALIKAAEIIEGAAR